MSNQFIDRGAPLEGINTAVRDSRVPFNLLRAIQNGELRDKRVSRRRGLGVYSSGNMRLAMLGKHTAATVEQENDIQNLASTSSDYMGKILKTPLSYGLLRWHNDFQWYVGQDKTVEFLFRIGESETLGQIPWVRETPANYTALRLPLRPNLGTIIFDQAILSNYFDGDWLQTAIDPINLQSYNIRPTAATNDVFAIPLLTLYYANGTISLHTCPIDSTTQRYNMTQYVISKTISHAPGTILRISIQYLAATRTLTLYINGVASGSLVLEANHVFPGELDYINGRSDPIHRDIVLLNECVARGSYQSTVKIQRAGATIVDGNQRLHHSYATTLDDRPEPMLQSPSRGCAIADLRYWGSRTAIEIQKTFDKILLEAEDLTNCISLFPLDTGGPICEDSVHQYRYVSVHRGLPAYVKDQGLLHGKGLHFSDGQHVKLEFNIDDWMYIDPAHTSFRDVFGWNENIEMWGRNDFTLQMQIRTPDTFQQEINRLVGASSITSTGGDTRDGMDVKAYGLCDGQHNLSVNWYDSPVRDELGTAVTTTQQRWHRAYDQTLWSAESQQERKGTEINDYADAHRVPCARGLLTPEGKIAFEFFGWQDTGSPTTSHSREARIVSTTTLQPGSVYTITFRKRMVYQGPLVPQPFYVALEIFIDGVLDVIGSVPCNTSQCLRNGGFREFVIGTSYANNHFDRCIESPSADSIILERRFVGQHAMSPYQDQPGFFTLGFARMWRHSLSDIDVASLGGKQLPNNASNGLVFNLEIENPTGNTIPDLGGYSLLWTLGYKSWGATEATTDRLTSEESAYIGWILEDCLGYLPDGPFNGLVDKYVDNGGKAVACAGLAHFASTLAQSYGILAIHGNTGLFDTAASGVFSPLLSPTVGLLAEFDPNHQWRGVSIGDKTVLTSYAGRPKIFDGRNLQLLGNRVWNGGRLKLSAQIGSGSLGAFWYGVAIAYYGDDGLYQVSPVSIINPQNGGALYNTIRVHEISPHPDPRFKWYAILLTDPQVSWALAKSAPLKFVSEYGALSNSYIKYIDLTQETTSSVVVSLDYTDPPVCAYAAGYNDLLYLAGDLVIPDAVYFGKPGNLGLWDTVVDRIILSEGSGDRIVGIQAMFGSLYAFKPNSIWRIDQVGINAVGSISHQVTRVAGIGPSSDRAYTTIVIPDSGRVATILWTQHGPYMFDEINVQSIGYPIEGEGDPFKFVDHASVFITHDTFSRSVWFHYKTRRENGAVSPVYDGLLVYNYRFNVWSTFTGIPGQLSLSLDLTKQQTVNSKTLTSFNDQSLALIGGSNGSIYYISDHKTDGLPGTLTDYGPYVITSFNVGVTEIEIEDPIDTGALSGLWVTVIRQNHEEWFQWPIVHNENKTIYLDNLYGDIDILPFQPQAGDLVYLCYAPVYLEFPWDQLDAPFINKQIQRLVVWAKGNLYYRLTAGWDIGKRPLWREVDITIEGSRKRIDGDIRNTEAVKLEVMSLAEDFRFDSYGYVITPLNNADGMP